MPKKVTKNSFGMVSSVSARGRENVPCSIRVLTPDQSADIAHHLKKRLDAVTVPGANWINIMNVCPDEMDLLRQRQQAYHSAGVWSV